jgi:hypothetical protein
VTRAHVQEPGRAPPHGLSRALSGSCSDSLGSCSFGFRSRSRSFGSLSRPPRFLLPDSRARRARRATQAPACVRTALRQSSDSSGMPGSRRSATPPITTTRGSRPRASAPHLGEGGAVTLGCRRLSSAGVPRRNLRERGDAEWRYHPRLAPPAEGGTRHPHCPVRNPPEEGRQAPPPATQTATPKPNCYGKRRGGGTDIGFGRIGVS